MRNIGDRELVLSSRIDTGGTVQYPTVTDRIRVKDGWLYRTFVIGSGVAVHTVFIADKDV